MGTNASDAVETVGGMALCEGVLMRAGSRWAMAVRRPGGAIAIRRGGSAGATTPWRSMPFVRGVVALADSFTLGIRAMTWSVEQARSEDDAPPPPVPLGRTIALALAIVVAVFFLVPAWVAGRIAGDSAVAFGAAEGGVRLSFLLAYLYAIGRLPEVRRLFGYHGAEHMVVATHEAGLPLTVENARAFGTRHARCGTTFLLVVMVLAVFAHCLVGTPTSIVGVFVTHVAMLPLIAATAYELLHAASRTGTDRWFNLPLRAAMSLQALTTRSPDDGQLEVAIAALDATTPALVAPALSRSPLLTRVGAAG